MPKKDYYSILGIGKDASGDEVKKALRHLARKFHPDVNPGDKSAEGKFKEINEAFQVLSEPEKRAAYDQYGDAGLEGMGFDPRQAGGFASFDDIFRDFGFGDIFDIFSGMGGRQSRGRRMPEEGADLKLDLKISLEDAFRGLTTKIEVPIYERCGTCRGTGAKPGTSPKRCPSCGGSGEVRTVRRMGFMQTISVSPCGECGGSGTIITERCGRCGGTGREKKIRNVEIKIPAGVDDGQYLRLEGRGEPGPNGGPPGDLYVVIGVEEHPIFERHERDLFCKTVISLAIAALGGEVEVPTVTGKARLKIPPGTQSHTVFRLNGQGMPDVHGRGRGDQLVKVVVRTPEKLSGRQKELIGELGKALGEEKPETQKGFFEKLRERM